ncbi:MAG: hypothetical protein IJ979_01400, partial [Tidjanibacter sp.]|nr:hypothetical protein [Tidjanibacter sp.]
QERGYVVDAACAPDEKGVPQADHVYELSFVKKMTAPQNFAAVLQLRKLLRAERYDFMCCHTSLAAYFARLAAMSLGKTRARAYSRARTRTCSPSRTGARACQEAKFCGGGDVPRGGDYPQDGGKKGGEKV